MKLFLFSLLLLIASCATKSPAPTPEPVKPEPVKVEEIKLGKKLTLWSTYYFTPLFHAKASGYPLRDKTGKELTGNLSLNHWCMIGLQGTGAVDGKTFTYQARTSINRVPCEKSFLRTTSYAKATGEIKFYPDKNEYGSGNRGNALTPYKSIACDQKIYKFGQKFYIPSAKGAILPDGTTHDGIFSCDDIGGAIKGNHIDTFIGFVDLDDNNFSQKYSVAYKQMPKQMQDYIKSTKSGTFTAYLVE